jgi:hypothetical protein
MCTDGAPSVVGSMRGFACLVKKENPDIVTTHCFLHRDGLVSKTLGYGVKNFWMVLQKWLILLKKDKFIRECLRNCVKTWTKSI